MALEIERKFLLKEGAWRNEKGDQLVELCIVVPKTEDSKLTAFMEEWRMSNHDDPRKAMLKGVPR